MFVVIYFVTKPPKPILAETDSILISDFTNTTGDPVFNDTLKEDVSFRRQQSPLVNVISDETVRAALKLMTKPPDARLTPELPVRYVSAGCGLLVEESIANLGGQFVIGLSAVDCQTGNKLAGEQ